MFTSVADLTEAITTWAEHWNTDPKPFIWKATAEEIITKSDEAAKPSTRSNHRRTTRPVERSAAAVMKGPRLLDDGAEADRLVTVSACSRR